MSEERIQNITSPQPEEQEIDLIELAQKVWASRKLVFKACGIAALVGLVVAFSIPKEYSTSVTLAPESGGKSGGGSMGALAAMAGTNLGTSYRRHRPGCPARCGLPRAYTPPSSPCSSATCQGGR